ncbi:MAG TPA: trehalose-phosphatase [Elusimicrobia bacterium]|nr:trehalose-phosphatase [Elusimicrobiota bacterium]
MTKPLLLCLDFDGTLAPFAKRLELARMPTRTRRLLVRLAERPGVRLAFVSGRKLSDIKARAAFPDACYIGNCGLELEAPGLRWLHPAARKAKPLIRALKAKLGPLRRRLPGLVIEDKVYSVNVHFRRARRRNAELIARSFLKPLVQAARGRLLLRRSCLVWEVLPSVDWDKGDAILLLAERLGGRWDIVFVGDDTADEEGFKTLGRRADTYRVGGGKTSARFRLGGRGAVYGLLRKLLR